MQLLWDPLKRLCHQSRVRTHGEHEVVQLQGEPPRFQWSKERGPESDRFWLLIIEDWRKGDYNLQEASLLSSDGVIEDQDFILLQREITDDKLKT